MPANAPGNLHSRLVVWLKVVLPLLALAILSTLFLVSRRIDPADAIPYATVDVADRIREPRMTAPVYAGRTSDGADLAITADAARPNADERTGGTAQAPHAVLQTPDGTTITIVARQGELDNAAGLLRLTGAVVITTSSGYVANSAAMTAALDRSEIISPGAVTVTGPQGVITAGQMTVTAIAATPGSYVVVFTNRVKLIYSPTK
ncbi:MAG: LPS export ABC transporter periplasmic protein LptC [Rhodobacteraceae bacterium CG2_30_10_405]|nr:MAG: LPS export ABC transporter periplasmic protein LptC [Rhodobacteraceae bacterium CG2_30_10_405]